MVKIFSISHFWLQALSFSDDFDDSDDTENFDFSDDSEFPNNFDQQIWRPTLIMTLTNGSNDRLTTDFDHFEDSDDSDNSDDFGE